VTGHPDAELLVLAALPAEPDDPDVQAHLDGCARCRAEVADLRRTVALAREGAGDLPAPPARVWEGIAAELGLTGEAHALTNGQVTHRIDGPVLDGPGPEAPEPVTPDDRGAAPHRDEPGSLEARRRRRLRRAAALAVAAVVGLVVGLGIGRVLVPPAPSDATQVAQLAPVGDLDPGATGTVAMATGDGERQMVVQVRGVTNIAGGDHLEAWLMDDSGTRLVPLGPLDGGGGDFHGTFALPEGLPLAQFGRVDVSAERWDGNPGHSAVSVLRGGCCAAS
jgi:anti-sigma-K factor RskA